LLLCSAEPPHAAQLTLNQQLIAASYKRDVANVVTCLRRGADASARFGIENDAAGTFRDAWDGGEVVFGLESWTPLIALASSNPLPDPPPGSGEVWKNSARCAELKQKIPREQIEKRREDGMIVLYTLLSHNCKLDLDDGNGATALCQAVENENLPIARTLLDFGANPNVRVRTTIDGPGGVTPLHAACGSKELLKLLLGHGADASVKDDEGQTPADWVKLDAHRSFDLIRDSNGWRILERSGKKQ